MAVEEGEGFRAGRRVCAEDAMEDGGNGAVVVVVVGVHVMGEDDAPGRGVAWTCDVDGRICE